MGTGGVFLRKLRARVSERPTGFVWIEKGKLAGSGYPASRGQLEWISASGINVILSLREEPIPIEWLKDLPTTVKHMPIRDHTNPDLSTLDKGAAFIQERLKAGDTVLVHCLAGEGRTGCVLAAYLIKDRRIGPDQALEILRKIKPEFVEWAQEKSIREYGEKLNP